MVSNQKFDPIILVCPYVLHTEEHMLDTMNKSYYFFKERNYNVVSSYNHENKKWVALDDLKPDILFFNNPHKITKKNILMMLIRNI